VRVLFFVREWPYVQRAYGSLILELAERGHDLELAFGERLRQEHVERLGSGFPEDRVRYSRAPRRERTDGWRTVAWLVRALGDLARYAHPRYAGAPRLRRRVAAKVLRRLETTPGLEPVSRSLALRLARALASRTDADLSVRVTRAAARLEESIPPSPSITRFIQERSPDVVLVTPVVKYGSDEVEYLKSARRLGIPGASCVASWDNLTNKGLLKFAPERVFVWNELQRAEAVDWHGIPPDRVVAAGAPGLDKWFEQRPGRSREQLLAASGLDAGRPYVLYVCSSPFVVNNSDDEVRFVLRLLEGLRASPDERLRGLGLMVRPHPRGGQWKRVDLSRFGNAVVWPDRPIAPVTPDALADFYDSLAYSAAVVGINTTAMIEAAIVGRRVLTVLEPKFAQESTLHFHHLLEENGGFLHVASSLDEHLGQLAGVLVEDESGDEPRLRFVQSFIRPQGLDRPSTSVLADAVEELAHLPVSAAADEASVPLRAALRLEAGLTRLLLVGRARVGRVRGLSLGLVGKARRHGLLPQRSGV
jgi:hypothetical protein